jgi:hypothetical protein
MEKHKTDESVKAGLKIEGDNHPLNKDQDKNIDNDDREPDDTGGEVDGDAVIHEQKDVPVTTEPEEEIDMDDLVHNTPALKTLMDNEEQDPDDLVHEK